jgi:hypothetical protein
MEERITKSPVTEHGSKRTKRPVLSQEQRNAKSKLVLLKEAFMT